VSAPTSPAVSAIVIFLDEERFLAEAVESILAQSFEDWELILVDDGSSDRSPELARSYARLHPRRIRCLTHPGGLNRGMSASRNLGIGAARGRYVGFLDADDVWMPEKLAEQCARLEAHPQCGLVYGRTLIWRSWNGGGEDFLYPLGVQPDAVYEPPRLFELLVENKAQSPTTCNALIRRSLFDAVGGFEDSFRDMFEDQAFFAKALLAAPAYVDGRLWAKYRQHEASCSARSGQAGGDLAHRRRVLEWMDRSLGPALAPHPSARARLRSEIRAIRRRALSRGARRWMRRIAAPLRF
jgi:glycosyltransferase involved in cell wall biosynthesis